LNKIRLGIIGLGYVGQIHLQNSLRLQHARVLAASDLSRKALMKARNMGVKKIFLNYQDILTDPEIDAVVIALPTHLHLQCARQAAEAKKHVFLEKPIARNVNEARNIVSIARHNSTKLMIGYHLRFDADFRALKMKIKEGILGTVEIALATFVGSGPFFHRQEGYVPVPVPEWWFNKELTGGGALMDLGSHMINLLRWYFGEIRAIKANFGHRLNMEVEDSAVCLAEFCEGTRAIINVGWFSRADQVKVELLGSVGHASAHRAHSNTFSTIVHRLMAGSSQFYYSQLCGLRYFVDCLIKDLSPVPSGQDGLKDLEAIDRAYRNEIHLA
jgi:predicted dehydrogenase